MRIKAVKTWKEDLQLKRPYTIAYETVDAVDNVFVLLEAENGTKGIGAGSPAEDVTGESIAACEKALSEKLPSILKDADILEYHTLLDTIERDMSETPAAMAAVDIALHDLIGHLVDRPLVDLLGRVHHTLPTSITVGIKPTQEMLEEVDEYVNRGFKILKIKIGLDVESDIERINKIREKAGPEMGIRVDANQGYSADAYLLFLKETRKANLEFVEQPLSVSETDKMQSLDKQVRLFSMADECLLKPAHAIALLNQPRPFGSFNIKLMKSGGIAPGLEIARMANLAGVDLMWGCMDESIVSISAALHAAFASPATKYLDLDGSLDLARDLVEGGFVLKDGHLRLTDKPGLGVHFI